MKKIVIANITGGLGNQMFQYAAAKSLSLSLGFNLYICIDSYALKKQHNGYELNSVFDIETPALSRSDLAKYLGRICSTYVIRQSLARMKYCRYLNKSFINEHYLSRQKHLITSRRPYYYLHGYWQSDKYFQLHETEIKKIFSFEKAKKLCMEHAQQIEDTNSVSIHVRRGDYVTNQKANKLHGQCSLDYYKKAIEHMLQSHKNCTFFVFTDTPEWAREHIKANGAPMKFVHYTGKNAYVDMYLMSICRHNIIANSSFSWWAAKLNENIQKTVIAPYNWFNKKETPTDLLPKTWKLM
ncbi:alpha-1,2-fucosyltransferase [Pseudohongiella sp. SYSU M77423]|uniref:alpha-1,2-fucosyltransferase n=1 Tax=Pseudohongiella sp. SYSU M77423 TaxID=3042312 RepID=UPI0024805222|nr:alpha-1,2-fucosyltransferase [Pseudohongiella sp. SYSU M77423]MDH7942939.1 alpha-1,2-fucosyltransferase [Pseudohongiella sp. SYSU M77423]